MLGAEQNSTIVFPKPIDILKPFMDIMQRADKNAGAAKPPPVLLPNGYPVEATV